MPTIDEIAAFHKARYENICALVRAVPAHMLHVSLRGMFWNEIARVMGGNYLRVLADCASAAHGSASSGQRGRPMRS